MSLVSFIIEILFLTISLSVDTFVSGLAYGSNKIKVPLSSIIIINLICSTILGITLSLGDLIGNFIPKKTSLVICISILLFLGIIKIFDSFIKNLIIRHNGIDKDIKVNIFSLKLTLNLYAVPEASDFDNSKIITFKEAFAIAIALSLDSLAIGFGTGLNNISITKIFFIIISSLLIGTAALLFGCNIGNKIAKKIKKNISWISGALLIFLAVMKFFK